MIPRKRRHYCASFSVGRTTNHLLRRTARLARNGTLGTSQRIDTMATALTAAQDANLQPRSAQALLARTKELTPMLSAQSGRNETAGRLTDEVIQALTDARIFTLFMPKQFDGAELWPTEGLQIIEALSYADGSTGWVTMATQVSMATAAAYLKPDAARSIFENSLPLIAGQGAPTGRADPEGTGYLIASR